MGLALSRALAVVARHRWTYAIPIATLLLPAAIVAVRMPDVYESRAVVRAREISTGGGGGSLPSEEGQRAFATVATARERLLKVENLRAVRPVLMPDARPDDPKVRKELLERIDFERLSDYAFTVTIRDTNPRRASDAVNTLLHTFLEGERAPLHRRAHDRRVFYDHEAAGAAERTRRAQDALARLRTERADSLPQLKDPLDRELIGLRGEIGLQEGVVATARKRVESLSDQIAHQGSTDAAPVAARTPTAEELQLEHQLAEQQKTLDAARKKLAEARTRYTERMPAVIALRSEVAGLQADLKATVVALGQAHARADAAEKARTSRSLDASTARLQALRKEAQEQADQAARAAASLRARARALEARLASIPATASALVPAERAVDEAQKRQANLEALAARAAERESFFANGNAEDVTPFAVAEWASPAPAPSGPRRTAWLLTAVGLGALLGYALSVLRRRFEDGAVVTREQVARLVPGAVVVAVPRLGDGRPRLRLPWRDLAPLAWTGACIALTVLVLAAHKGWIEGPLWLRELIGRPL
jgi:uncharacterized protein involved in exopolysaccharide biosynthesis